MGSTIAEKILARAAGRDEVSPGDHVVCDIDIAMSHDSATPGVLKQFEQMDLDEVWDPSRIIIPFDHIAPSHTVNDANIKTRLREFIEEQGIENFYEVGTGISHEVLPEKGHVRPGELIVGTDSHTTSHGVFGAASTGIGHTDMAYVYATGQLWFRIPKSIEFEITGTIGSRVSAKDVVLHIAGEYGTDVGRYRSIEYRGSAIEELPIDDRFILSNMSIELGAKFGFLPVDDKVIDYIDERSNEPYEPKRSDADATYERTYKIDADEISPKVSEPHKVGNVVDVTEVRGTELDQVFLGSCTNGKLEDLRTAAAILDGREVASGTRFIITPASREIYSRAEQEGLLRTFSNANAVVTNPTCGACIGRGMGLIGDGEVCLAAQNRNFRGRMGSDKAEIYLSSPETAAASAISGHITDPREV